MTPCHCIQCRRLPPAYPKYPTIIHALAKAAELRPECAGASSAKSVSSPIANMRRRSPRWRADFADVGVARERIAFVVSNGLEACVGLLAGMAARAQIAPLNPNYTEARLEPLLRDVDPKVVVCDAGSAEKAAALAHKDRHRACHADRSRRHHRGRVAGGTAGAAAAARTGRSLGDVLHRRHHRLSRRAPITLHRA